MDLSYRERSILGSLAATVVVFGLYFAKLLRVSRGGPLEAGDVLWMMIAAVIALIAIEIVFHILISVGAGEPPPDERDKLIAARAGRNAGVALAVAANVLIVTILLNEVLRGVTGAAMGLTPVVIAQVVLLALIVAQVFQYASQLYYYRRGMPR